jgi:hypothetical protein
MRCRAWGFLACFAGPLGLLLGSRLLYWSLVAPVARVLVSALVLLLLFEAFYPARSPSALVPRVCVMPCRQLEFDNLL